MDQKVSIRKYKKPLCDLVEKTRVGANLSQAEFASKVGVQQSKISDIENCSDSISLEYIIKTLVTFGIDISSMIPTYRTMSSNKFLVDQFQDELSILIGKYSDLSLNNTEMVGVLRTIENSILNKKS